ncbi:hypothetical protein QUF58_10475 [Anaerolineales bacterium HSG24]|nr:hypothetical protein [Anaerolineales bacterium HSG24]
MDVRQAKKKQTPLLLLAVIISLLVSLLVQLPALTDKYRIITDLQNFYWLARANDPTLFSTDYIYMIGQDIIMVNWGEIRLFFLPVSLGHSLLFFVTSYFLDYLWVSKIVIFVLMPISVIYLFKLGQFLDNTQTGLTLSLFFAYFIAASPDALALAHGFQRAFTAPLVIIFLYSFIKQQYILTATIIFVSTLFYFPLFPIMVLTYGLGFCSIGSSFPISLQLDRHKLLPFIISLAFSVVPIALVFAMNWDVIDFSKPLEPLPNLSSNGSLVDNPHFQTGGYVPLFFAFPFLGQAGLFDTGGDALNFLTLMILSGFMLIVLGRASLTNLPVSVWYLLVAGLTMYVLAIIFVFGLSSLVIYLPSRYSRATLLVAILFFVGLNWVEFVMALPQWLSKNHRIIRLFLFSVITFVLVIFFVGWLSPFSLPVLPMFFLIGVIVMGVLIPFGGTIVFWLVTSNQPLSRYKIVLAIFIALITIFMMVIHIHIVGPQTINPTKPERDLYEFVALLPKGALLAGEPKFMTNIPLFSKRSVLFRGLHPKNDYAILDFFTAKYTNSPNEITDFCKKYNVTYLAVDVETFNPSYLAEGDFFYEPYNSYITEMLVGKTNFILPNRPPIFQSDSLRVIPCN